MKSRYQASLENNVTFKFATSASGDKVVKEIERAITAATKEGTYLSNQSKQTLTNEVELEKRVIGKVDKTGKKVINKNSAKKYQTAKHIINTHLFPKGSKTSPFNKVVVIGNEPADEKFSSLIRDNVTKNSNMAVEFIHARKTDDLKQLTNSIKDGQEAKTLIFSDVHGTLTDARPLMAKATIEAFNESINQNRQVDSPSLSSKSTASTAELSEPSSSLSDLSDSEGESKADRTIETFYSPPSPPLFA